MQFDSAAMCVFPLKYPITLGLVLQTLDPQPANAPYTLPLDPTDDVACL